MNSSIRNSVSYAQIAAIIITVIGWGWAAGNFTPQDQPLNAFFHFIPLALLLLLSLRIFHNPIGQPASNRNWGIVGMTIFSIVGIIAAFVLIYLGTSTDPNAIGVKNFNDWVPTIIMLLGAFLWLGLTVNSGLQKRTSS